MKAALLAETGAICDPYLAALRCVECAIANGVELRLNEEVLDIQRGYGRYLVRTSAGGLYRSRVVVNAAGVFADKINNMVSDHRLHIVPRRGDYQLFDTDFGDFFPIPCFRFLPGKAREFW